MPLVGIHKWEATYPPSPQEPGSVTFNAAETATAASAFEA